MAQDGQIELSQVQMVVDGLDHPECVTVDPDCVLWAGGEDGQVYRIDPDAGTAWVVGSTGGFLLGVTVDGGQHAYLCDIKKLALLRMQLETGAVETVCTEVEGRPLINPNYAVFDRDGRLYVSDSGHFQADDGYIFVLEPDGRVHVVSEEARRFPNGLALDHEQDELYIVESTLPGVTRLHLGSGRLETVAELPGTVPDGLALDRDRNVYIGCYRPDTILRISPSGVEVLATDPHGTVIAAPTNLAFGGRDGRTLYIASLGRWHIGAIRLEVPGLPLWYPARSSPGD